MESEGDQVYGNYRVEALGDVAMIARGDAMLLRAAADTATVNVMAGAAVNLMAGPGLVSVQSSNPAEAEILLLGGLAGKITQTVGPPFVGPRIEMEPTKITLAIGPPVVGASITLELTGITLSIGTTTLKLTATGIEESVLAGLTARQATPAGHKMVAAETALKVGVEGVSSDGPLFKNNVEGVAKFQSLLSQVSVSAMSKQQSGITMEGG
jgi:hypothetical protein